MLHNKKKLRWSAQDSLAEVTQLSLKDLAYCFQKKQRLYNNTNNSLALLWWPKDSDEEDLYRELVYFITALDMAGK